MFDLIKFTLPLFVAGHAYFNYRIFGTLGNYFWFEFVVAIIFLLVPDRRLSMWFLKYFYQDII
jgi:hypothetical protein